MAKQEEQGAIRLRRMESFHVAGHRLEVRGRPAREVIPFPGGVPVRLEDDGTYEVGQMYVQRFEPEPRRGRCPIVLVHGGGMTGANWETTPDGREGWLTMLLRRGWEVCNVDQPERGRSGYIPYPEHQPGERYFFSLEQAFNLLRIGAGSGAWSDDPAKRRMLPGCRFPGADFEAFARQFSPGFTANRPAQAAALTSLVDRLGECILLFHSQGASVAFDAAEARPGKVKALLAIEPAVGGSAEGAKRLAGTPILALYGDFIAEDPLGRWPRMLENAQAYYARIRAAGGAVEELHLPERGIRGNSHMLMMDDNNAELLGLLHDWLAGKGLWD